MSLSTQHVDEASRQANEPLGRVATPPLNVASVVKSSAAATANLAGTPNSSSLNTKFSTFNINNQFKGKAIEPLQKSSGMSNLYIN